MATATDFANWAIEAAVYNAVSLGTLTPIDAIAVLLDAVVVNCEDNPTLAQAVASLLEESGLKNRLADLLAEEDGDARHEAVGLGWAVEGVYSYFDGDGILLLLRAAAGIAATEDQVTKTLAQMSLQARLNQAGIFAQEQVIKQAIEELIAKVEALQSPVSVGATSK
jgi:hypothetical protein